MVVIPAEDLERIKQYCEERVPAALREQMRLEVQPRGRSVTIVECRPIWQGVVDEDWTTHRVAQLRYDSEHVEWTLFWADRSGSWHLADSVGPGTVQELLDELTLDRSAVFWG